MLQRRTSGPLFFFFSSLTNEHPNGELEEMNSRRNIETEEEDGALWRSLVLSEEDRLPLSPATTRSGGYRWFKSENVVCIEHFRRARGPDWAAGRFGWVKP
jgi:hypothetical protein